MTHLATFDKHILQVEQKKHIVLIFLPLQYIHCAAMESLGCPLLGTDRIPITDLKTATLCLHH